MSYNYAQFLELELGEDENYNIYELNFSEQELTTLPESIGNCVNLRVLNCNKNNLTFLPESLGNCIELKELDCSYNKLTKIPQSIWKCVNLIKLNCSYNNLTNLDEIIKLITPNRKCNDYDNEGREKCSCRYSRESKECNYDRPQAINSLHDILLTLDCSNNQITHLPKCYNI